MPRRPGITFETVTPSPPETLPRMDVAAFVGFATRGPIGVPVPVEDVARFRDVFGPPLELVRDPEAGRTKTAHLHRAVKAFFRNGGRRCWIVRVAQPADEASSSGTVERTSFGLPGLVSAETGQPSTVRARCYGATFDGMRVGTVLRRRLLPDPSAILRRGEGTAPSALTLSWKAGRRNSPGEDALAHGDLLRLSTDGAVEVYAAVASQTRIATNGHLGVNGSSLEVKTDAVHAFTRDPTALRKPVAGGVTETEERTEVEVEVKAPTRPGIGSFDATMRRTTDADDRPVFRVAVEKDLEIDASDLETQVVHVRGLEGALVGWLQLGHASRGGTDVAIDVREALWPIDSEEVFRNGALSGVESVERQRFDLLAWEGQELQTRLNHLGFTRPHPRAWTALPVDEDLFAVEEGEAVPPEPGTLRADVFDPRFPLASPEAPGEGPFVPLGMADRSDPSRTRGHTASAETRGSRLERERLATFSTDVFVDSTLAGTSTANLGEKADDMIYVDQNPASGLHSLWPIREATLLAVPDAVHRGWRPTKRVETTAAPTPSFEAVEVQTDGETPYVRLSWDVDRLGEGGVEVQVQEASEPTFEAPVVRYRGADPSVERFVEDAPKTLYFRFRVITDDVPGGWSDTRRADVPDPEFTPCTKPRPDVPDVDLVDQGDRWWLRWEPLGDPQETNFEYEVQVDTLPTFDTSESVVGPAKGDEEGTFPLASDPPGSSNPGNGGEPTDHLWHDLGTPATKPAIRYARVRARRASGGPPLYGRWTRTIPITHSLQQERPLISKGEYDDPDEDPPSGGRAGLYDVHQAMLRFAAARGDVLSVLSLPRHDQPDDARRHVARLRTPGAVLDYGEERTLSYGALYYPWLLGPVDDEARITPMPPDGAACGMIADRTLRDGAWMAPANISLADVPTVVPPLTSDERAPLEASPLNVFTETPKGVLTLGTATLARDPDLEPITTRRLLILVRRLVRREGPALVFENSTPLLRRRIAEQLDDTLRRLFDRGAFAGATPSEGYRIVADESVNPPRQVERGRLVVELRVAPARPLKFLTVRLVQRSGQRPTISESGTGAPA